MQCLPENAYKVCYAVHIHLMSSGFQGCKLLVMICLDILRCTALKKDGLLATTISFPDKDPVLCIVSVRAEPFPTLIHYMIDVALFQRPRFSMFKLSQYYTKTLAKPLLNT